MPDSTNRVLDAFASTLGAILHLLLLPLFLSMGLIVPAWFLAVLLGVWLLMVMIAVFKRGDELYLVAAPVVAVVVLIVVITIGGQLLDWTA